MNLFPVVLVMSVLLFSRTLTVTADMEEFIKEYIAEANKEIEIFNRQLELQGQPDLFDP